MKKLEKLNSKLFEEFKMDEVGELASVVGGMQVKTTYDGQTRSDTCTPGTTYQQDLVIGTLHSCDSTRNGHDCGIFTDPVGPEIGTGLSFIPSGGFSEEIGHYDATINIFQSEDISSWQGTV